MKIRIMALAAVLAVSLASPSSGQSSPARTDRPRQPVVVEVSEGGFRWGDAAIGAAAVSGAGVALVGASMFRRQLLKEER